MPLRVVDVSGNNGIIRWADVAQSGIRAAWCKATEGVRWIDPTFFRNVAAARQAGALVGAYHYLRIRVGRGALGQDGAAQARDFLAALRRANATDLLPMVDVETMENAGATAAEVSASLGAFVSVVFAELGAVPNPLHERRRVARVRSGARDRISRAPSLARPVGSLYAASAPSLGAGRRCSLAVQLSRKRPWHRRPRRSLDFLGIGERVRAAARSAHRRAQRVHTLTPRRCRWTRTTRRRSRARARRRRSPLVVARDGVVEDAVVDEVRACDVEIVRARREGRRRSRRGRHLRLLGEEGRIVR